MNLRKIRERTTCLYSEDSTEPRSLSAVSQRVCSKDFVDFLVVGFLAMPIFASLLKCGE